jgi:hypothetical protein
MIRIQPITFLKQKELVKTISKSGIYLAFDTWPLKC